MYFLLFNIRIVPEIVILTLNLTMDYYAHKYKKTKETIESNCDVENKPFIF